jgi:hypothetical protein
MSDDESSRQEVKSTHVITHEIKIDDSVNAKNSIHTYAHISNPFVST